MWLYNFLFSVIVFSIIFLNKKNYDSFYKIMFITFFILSFIRWETGTDWETYYYIFDKKIEDMAYVSEIGFRMINYYVNKLTNNYTILLLLMAAVIYPLKYLMIKRYSKNILFSLLIFFSLYKADIFFVRMTVAVAINFYAFNYILKQELIKFIGFVLLACIFHRTAIIFLIAYPIVRYIKFTMNKMYCIFFVAIIFYVFNYEIINLLNLFLKKIDLTFVENISFKLNLYLETKNIYFGNDQRNLNNSLKMIITVVNRVFIYVIILWKAKKLDFFSQKSLLLYGIGYSLFFLLTPISVPLGRLTAYFDIFELIIIPNIYMTLKNRTIKKLFIMISIVYFYLKLFSGIYTYYGAFIPYKTIF